MRIAPVPRTEATRIISIGSNLSPIGIMRKLWIGLDILKTGSSLTPMSKKKPKSRSVADILFDTAGAIVPSCGSALKMVELGQERPLNMREKFVLLYNTPLCPHCRCNKETFVKERAKMREIASARK
jgi:hypothetical protein